MAWFDRKKDRYRPTSPRQRLLIVVLAIGTAIGVMAVLLAPQIRLLQTPRPLPADAAPCAKGQLSGCVGGKLDVIVVPPPAASAAVPAR